ncbi:RNA-dependent RNA polymerase family protein [Prosthecobacter sp.]
MGPAKPKEGQGSFVSNVTSAPVHRVEKVNYMFDGPVEIHLLSVLWLMIEGPEYDHTLTSHCSGSRLHQFVGNDEDHSAYLFKKYHELYAKWRDSGIQKAQALLSEDRQSVCVVGLDVQEYYYRIQLDWEALRTQIKRPVPAGPLQAFFMQRQLLGAKLFKCIEEVCKSYREKLNPLLAVTHPDLPDGATCLPIGLCASPVIANWYLKAFDDAILENVRPAYFGRYVDDILMVVAMPKPPEESDPIMSFMDRVLVNAGVLKWDEQEARFELRSRPGLFLQKRKCILQFFDAEHSTAGLEKFQKQIEENASDFALLPVDGDDSPVAQVAYDLLYDGSVNKFRSVKAVAENRWELAGHLAKQTQLHLMTEGAVDKDLKDELFRFFKGRNAIDYWDMWERVISFLVIAGDQKGAERFSKAMRSETTKMKYSSSNGGTADNRPEVSIHLRQTLAAHLDLCMELSLAVTKSTGDGGDSATRLWRKSNLIRHHLVAIPLLNYTNYEGNLASPSGAASLVIDQQKVVNTPRFVHFDECLGFVDSGCARPNKRDAVARANEVYKQFHGSELDEVASELIGEEESK